MAFNKALGLGSFLFDSWRPKTLKPKLTDTLIDPEEVGSFPTAPRVAIPPCKAVPYLSRAPKTVEP